MNKVTELLNTNAIEKKEFGNLKDDILKLIGNSCICNVKRKAVRKIIKKIYAVKKRAVRKIIKKKIVMIAKIIIVILMMIMIMIIMIIIIII